MASPISTPAAVLKLATNVPEVIALAFDEGRPCKSQYQGDQVMFSLEDGRKYFAPPAVARAIEEAGVAAHVPFEICKREVTIGNRRTLRHEIRVLPNKTSAATLPASAPVHFQGEAVLPAKNVTSSTQSSARAALVPSRAQAEAIAHELAAELAKPAAVETPEPGGRLMACYRHAIDVAIAAQRYAKERGVLIEPQFEDIRAAAATLYMNGSDRGRA